MVAKFLAGLSPEYAAAKDQMLTGSEIPELSDAYNRLSRLAISLSQPTGVTSASALVVGGGRGHGTGPYSARGRGIGRGTGGRGRFQCTYCGKIGHLEDRCWDKHGRPSLSQGRNMVTKQGKSPTHSSMGSAQIATPTVEDASSSTVPETVTVSIDRVEYEQFLAHKASHASASTALTDRAFSVGPSTSDSDGDPNGYYAYYVVMNGVKQEVIVDLVEQCRNYQKRVMVLVNSTTISFLVIETRIWYSGRDEGLLGHGLMLNDELQRVLTKHDEIAKGIPSGPKAPKTSVSPVNVIHEEDESEDDFAQLAHRSSRDGTLGQNRSSTAVNEHTRISPLLPPPPSQKVNKAGASSVDYLSGDTYKYEMPEAPKPKQPVLPQSLPSTNSNSGSQSPPAPFVSSPPPRSTEPSTTSSFENPWGSDGPSVNSKDDEKLPAVSKESSSTCLPPPPARHSQRQQFFEQQQQQKQYGSEFPSAGLISKTQNLSVNPSGTQESSTPSKQAKPEDNLFKDLVDFAKAKSSKPKSPRSSPSHRQRPLKPSGKRAAGDSGSSANVRSRKATK
ncbi:hypothetical protein EJ110_NYTH40953 [Nymphaea thermarum]|nr:hypothetical protein EJ110_NYTH40953 [Nymphaea thermarum]